MEKINEGLYKATNKEIRKMNASDFQSGDVIYIADAKSGDFKYIIELDKGEYKTFALKTRVCDANTKNYLSCIPGSSKGFRPYYIHEFIHR